jgi:hypothetical protein
MDENSLVALAVLRADLLRAAPDPLTDAALEELDKQIAEADVRSVTDAAAVVHIAGDCLENDEELNKAACTLLGFAANLKTRIGSDRFDDVLAALDTAR